MKEYTEEERLEVYNKKVEIFKEMMKNNVDANGNFLVSETWARKNILGQTPDEIKEIMTNK